MELQPRKVLAQARKASRRLIHGHHVGAGMGKLRGFAARGRAQIGDAQSAHVAEELGGQGGRGILHPPFTFRVARHPRHGPARHEADRAGGQNLSAEQSCCLCRITFHRQIKRRFNGVNGGNGARGRFAVGRGPAPHQPFRSVERNGVDAGEKAVAFAHKTAQHRIDEAGIGGGAAVGAREPD